MWQIYGLYFSGRYFIYPGKQEIIFTTQQELLSCLKQGFLKENISIFYLFRNKFRDCMIYYFPAFYFFTAWHMNIIPMSRSGSF